LHNQLRPASHLAGCLYRTIAVVSTWIKCAIVERMFYVHYIVFSFVLIFASVVDNMNGSIRVQCSRGPKQEQFVWFSLTSDQTKILMQFILTLPNPLILYGYII